MRAYLGSFLLGSGFPHAGDDIEPLVDHSTRAYLGSFLLSGSGFPYAGIDILFVWVNEQLILRQVLNLRPFHQ